MPCPRRHFPRLPLPSRRTPFLCQFYENELAHPQTLVGKNLSEITTIYLASPPPVFIIYIPRLGSTVDRWDLPQLPSPNWFSSANLLLTRPMQAEVLRVQGLRLTKVLSTDNLPVKR